MTDTTSDPEIPGTMRDELVSLSKQFIADRKEHGRYSGPGTGTDQYVNELEQHGYTVLGAGVGRIAVTHPSINGNVIKVALHTGVEHEGFSASGTAQNATEARAWNKMPDDVRKRFTKVYETTPDSHLLYCPQVTTDEDEIPYGAAERFVTETRKALRTHGWDAVGLMVTEVGKTSDGNLVVFDYGLPVAPIEYIISEGAVVESDYRFPDL